MPDLERRATIVHERQRRFGGTTKSRLGKADRFACTGITACSIIPPRLATCLAVAEEWNGTGRPADQHERRPDTVDDWSGSG